MLPYQRFRWDVAGPGVVLAWRRLNMVAGTAHMQKKKKMSHLSVNGIELNIQYRGMLYLRNLAQLDSERAIVN